MPSAQRRWTVFMRVRSRAAISVHVDESNLELAGETCSSPSEAVRAVEDLLAEFDPDRDEVVLVLRAREEVPSLWQTRSAASALYWCATMLAKAWPPRWSPLIDRRGSDLPKVEPPLVDRRGMRSTRRNVGAD